MAEKTAAAALLERRAEQNEKASERIARDPEEAHAALKDKVEPTPGSEQLTMRDMFGLFLQLQNQIVGFQQQLLEIQAGQRPQSPRQSTEDEIAQHQEQQRLTRERWNTETREPVFIPPSVDEQKAFAVVGEWPPRLFQVNGIDFPIKVNTVVEVPRSIAELVRYTQGGKSSRPDVIDPNRPPYGLPQIGDPQRGQFLAGSQEISVGRAGKSGEGRVVPSPLPPRPQELGEMYDAYGQ